MQNWTFVFDLDGTLIDTAPDLAAATNHVLSRFSLSPVDENEIRPFVGQGALKMIEKALASHGKHVSQDELFDLFEVFIAYYAAHIADASRPYPGIIAALDRLGRDGAKLAVCTNKIESLARQLLDALGMTRHFDAITGRDSLGAYKPDPKHLTGTIALANGDAGRAAMIGDSETDIATAKAAGIPVVAVNFGYSIEPVAIYGPDVVIGHFDELEPALARIVASRGRRAQAQ